MLRSALWAIAVVSFLSSIWIVVEFGLSRPRAIFGAIIWGVMCSLAARRESTRAKVRRSVVYEAEVQVVRTKITEGMTVDEAREVLSRSMKFAGSTRAMLVLHGSVDVSSFVGGALAVDVFSKNGRVISTATIALTDERRPAIDGANP